jgi:hypothetical protein
VKISFLHSAPLTLLAHKCVDNITPLPNKQLIRELYCWEADIEIFKLFLRGICCETTRPLDENFPNTAVHPRLEHLLRSRKHTTVMYGWQRDHRCRRSTFEILEEGDMKYIMNPCFGGNSNLYDIEPIRCSTLNGP